MKIRNGFVSNSSTTNFVIVGVDIDPYTTKDAHPTLQQLRHKIQPEGKDPWDLYKEHWGGWTNLGDGLAGYGWDSDIYYVGIDALENWKNGMSFKDAFKVVKKLIKKKYDIDIPDKYFDIYNGEAGNG